jgi:putative redox protein
MQVLLASLAGCTSIDIINMLSKQRQRLDDFKVVVTSERTGGIPSPFTKINLHFVFKGKIKEQKIEKALESSHTKYCSVYFSLNPNIDITNTYELEYAE